jgi:hypothetical protein
MKQHGQENKRPEKICALTFVLALAAILIFTATAAQAQYRVGDFTKGSITVGYDTTGDTVTLAKNSGTDVRCVRKDQSRRKLFGTG